MTPVIVFQVGVQPIEMQFLLSEIPPLILLPLVQGAKIFLVESHINHPRFVRGFQQSLQDSILSSCGTINIGLFFAWHISASVNPSAGYTVLVHDVLLFSFEIRVGSVICEGSFNGIDM